MSGLSHSIRLLALALNGLATELERPEREGREIPAPRPGLDIFEGCEHLLGEQQAPEC
jgi:hypothetical protein